MTKHLWEYNNKALFEVEINHKAKEPYYESWKEFITEGKQALECNCTCTNSLVWWYWDESEDEDENEKYEKSDMLNLIYGNWFSGLSRFVIKVEKSNEEEIKQYIKLAQSKTVII